jgi:hypothetical protein
MSFTFGMEPTKVSNAEPLISVLFLGLGELVGAKLKDEALSGHQR